MQLVHLVLGKMGAGFADYAGEFYYNVFSARQWGSSMPVNRFWASIGSAASFLFAIGLLHYILLSIVTLFGLLPASIGMQIELIAAVLVPVVGSLVFVKWRWNWSPEHVGLSRNQVSAVWLFLGAVVGLVAGFLAVLLTRWMGGQGLFLGIGSIGVSWVSLLFLLLSGFVVELVYRGVLVSRFQADLNHRELLLAAILAPFAWTLIQQFFRFDQPPTQIVNAWSAAMSVALALIFIRYDSVWLTAGLRFGMFGAISLLGTTRDRVESGGLLVWGTIAAVLLVLEWRKLQGTPQRVQPSRGPRGLRTSGRTVRGPWGPH
jgi:membrane protease YdiL (CAAX protease family)